MTSINLEGANDLSFESAKNVLRCIIGYETKLRDDGIEQIIKYGIVCYKKRCRVQVGGE